MLLAQLVLMAAGCLLILLGFFARTSRWWGVFALVALMAAGCLLVAVGPTAGDATPGAPHSLLAAVQWTGLGIGLWFVLIVWDARRDPEAFGWLLLTAAGVMLLGSVNDLVTMLLALELVSGSTLMLLAFSREAKASGQTIGKMGLMTVSSSLLLLYGFGLLYGLTGTTNLAEIHDVLTTAYAPDEPNPAVGSGSRMGIAAIVLIFAGLGFRLGVVPFHFGTPDVHQGSTAWQAGLLVVAPKAAAFIVLIRLLRHGTIGFEATAQLLAGLLAGITMLLCSAAALWQTNVRRILAYTTLAHGGFVLMGLAAGVWESAHPETGLHGGHGLPGGFNAALFDLGCHLLAVAGLFGVLAYLARPGRQVEFLEELSGLARFEPWAAACSLVILLSLAGFPPFSGFWGRVWLLAATFSVPSEPARIGIPGPHAGFYLLGLVATVSTILIAAVYLRIASVLCLESPAGRPQPAGGQSALAAGVIAAMLTVGIGLLPGPLLGYFTEVPSPPTAHGAAGKTSISRYAWEHNSSNRGEKWRQLRHRRSRFSPISQLSRGRNCRR